MLNPKSKLIIQTELKKHFGVTKLTINIAKPLTQTMSQKETQALKTQTISIQKQFLNNKSVQTLQKTFNAKIETQSIKKITTDA